MHTTYSHVQIQKDASAKRKGSLSVPPKKYEIHPSNEIFLRMVLRHGQHIAKPFRHKGFELIGELFGRFQVTLRPSNCFAIS